MLAFFLVFLGVASRLVVHTPQFTAILAVAMFGGMYLGQRQALIVPVALMIITDIVLGFHDTMFFTWGSMLIVSAVGLWLKERKSFGTVLAGSIVSSGIFFVVTNFGVWAVGGLYPGTAEGLWQCYVAAIPFFRQTLLGDLVYVAALFSLFAFAAPPRAIPQATGSR